MGKLTVDFPGIPKGKKVEVPGYGVFENGSTTEVEKLSGDLTIPESAPDPVEQLTSDHNKQELEQLAKEQGVEVSGKTKDDLARELVNQEGE